ncbi:G-PROTEIN-RECEP-F1-2 domain-containing protein [Aphelenchoides besseyi]|nr:G-PROTEIN-RECEP-F1-2 domain-containing protein [Aphelenchoides besseyi]
MRNETSLLPTFILATYDQLVSDEVSDENDSQHLVTYNEIPQAKWRHPLLAFLFIMLCLITVAGNVLVVVAVCTKKYLRNPTGYLIVSLAFADLIVGMVVMPLNSVFEMTNHVWLLGMTMCDIFHALDILASTSSIWNLCVISLDRYMAGQDPIGYRDKVSKRRITIAIIFVWVMSACLSFPAIIWWRHSSPHLYEDKYRCVFTDNWLYVGFSSLVSFYVPMILILFAYGRVFLIATRHSQQMKSGVKKLKQKNRRPGSEGGLLDDTAATLRIHFGRAKTKGRNSAIANVILAANGAAVSSQRLNRFRHTEASDSKTNVGTTTTEETNTRSSRSTDSQSRLRQNDSDRSVSRNSTVNQPLLHSERSSVESRPVRGRPLKSASSSISSRTTQVLTTPNNNNNTHCEIQIVSNPIENNNVVMDSLTMPRIPREDSIVALSSKDESNTEVTTCLLPASQQHLAFKKKIGMREKSRQMMRYVHEQRAARTLSIIVGAFILCWLPFFIVSPIMAVCSNCVGNQELVFSVITWVGHINSLINPLIYSRFSRDFRKAFKQILTCQREKPTRKAIKTPLNIVFAQLVSITQMFEQPDVDHEQ